MAGEQGGSCRADIQSVVRRGLMVRVAEPRCGSWTELRFVIKTNAKKDRASWGGWAST